MQQTTFPVAGKGIRLRAITAGAPCSCCWSLSSRGSNEGLYQLRMVKSIPPPHTRTQYPLWPPTTDPNAGEKMAITPPPHCGNIQRTADMHLGGGHQNVRPQPPTPKRRRAHECPRTCPIARPHTGSGQQARNEEEMLEFRTQSKRHSSADHARPQPEGHGRVPTTVNDQE